MPRRPMRDVLVVIPGILGSALRQNGRDVWNLSTAAGLHAFVSAGASVRELALTEDSADPDVDVDGVQATGLLPDLHVVPYLWKIDGYAALASTLADAFALERNVNYFEFAYDWRRDNRVAARRLASASAQWLREWRAQSGNATAKLVILAHSMGGLVARYFLEALAGWRDTKALVTFGTPYRGSVNALRSLAEGVRKGPFGVVDLSRFVRSLTSTYQLLPIYPCLALPDGSHVRLADAPPLANVSAARVRAAADFHREIRDAVDANLRSDAYVSRRYRVIPIVGTFQPTLQSAQLNADDTIEYLHQHSQQDLQGDGTVPRISATPVERSNDGLEVFVASPHASLQNARDVLHHVCEAIASLDLDLTGEQYRALAQPPCRIALELDDAYWHDEPIALRVRVEPPPAPALDAAIAQVAAGAEVARVSFPAGRDGWMNVELPPLASGAYRCTVSAHTGAQPAADVFNVYRR